jgi:hypothetical protein
MRRAVKKAHAEKTNEVEHAFAEPGITLRGQI